MEEEGQKHQTALGVFVEPGLIELSGFRQSPISHLRRGTALADARATDLSLGLFSSPTVREGYGL
jgi:hypothetical protein